MKRSWKDLVRAVLPWKVYWQLKRWREEWRGTMSKGDLTSLAKVYKTDKVTAHFYTPVYERWFELRRNQPLRLLEIGVGGYTKTLQGGDSLRMWKKYFPKGQITGIDIYDKENLQEERIRIYKGDQSDADFLKEVSAKEGPFDIIIDDGSHLPDPTIASFEILFPLMAPGGIYVVEDTQTSYWPKWQGSTRDMDTVHSAMNYFIKLVHHVNRSEWRKDELAEEIPDRNIETIAFYHNLIFIVKKSISMQAQPS